MDVYVYIYIYTYIYTYTYIHAPMVHASHRREAGTRFNTVVVYVIHLTSILYIYIYLLLLAQIFPAPQNKTKKLWPGPTEPTWRAGKGEVVEPPFRSKMMTKTLKKPGRTSWGQWLPRFPYRPLPQKRWLQTKGTPWRRTTILRLLKASRGLEWLVPPLPKANHGLFPSRIVGHCEPNKLTKIHPPAKAIK